MRERFDLIVACDLNRGIGKNNQVPWNLPQDRQFFKKVTSESTPDHYNAVIMGRRTWDSLPQKPLMGRYNVVMTRNDKLRFPEGTFRATSLDNAFDILETGPVDKVFIIGGAEIYTTALAHERVGLLYLTEIRQQFDCDTFFPDYKPFFQLISSSEILNENGIDYCFKVYKPNLLA